MELFLAGICLGVISCGILKSFIDYRSRIDPPRPAVLSSEVAHRSLTRSFDYPTTPDEIEVYRELQAIGATKLWPTFRKMMEINKCRDHTAFH